jgi:hypothetical protein
MTTPTAPDFTDARTPDAPDPSLPGLLTAAFALARELRTLDANHAAAVGLRRAVALLATHVLIEAHDARQPSRAAQRLLDWLEALPDAEAETVWVRVL